MHKLAVAVVAVLALPWGSMAAQEGDSAISIGPQQPSTDASLPVTAEAVNARLTQLFGASEPFAEAFAAIQAAVIEGDAATLAQWVAYPFRVSYDDQELVVEDEAAFVEHYHDIVGENVVEAVAGQTYEGLFVNADGAMFGNGQLWMTMICEDEACTASSVRIIAIQSVLR